MEVIIIDRRRLKIMLSSEDVTAYGLEHCDGYRGDAETKEALRHLLKEVGEPLGVSCEGERVFVQLYTSREGGCELFVTLSGESSPRLDNGGEKMSSSASGDGEAALLRKVLAPEEEAAGERGGRHGGRIVGDPAAPTTRTFGRGHFRAVRETRGGMRAGALAVEESPGASGSLCDGQIRGSMETTRRTGWVVDSFPALLGLCRRLQNAGVVCGGDLYRGESGAWCLLLEIPEDGLYGIPLELSFLYEYGREEDGEALWRYAAEYGRLIRRGDAVSVLGDL